MFHLFPSHNSLNDIYCFYSPRRAKPDLKSGEACDVVLRIIVVVVVVVSEIIRYSSLLVTPKSTVEKRRRKNYLQHGDYMDQEKELIFDMIL